jgi:predicted acylesterase/phospholipase RssA
MSGISVEEVLDRELQQVQNSRNLRLGENPSRPPASETLVGLAFSGGGIRSATYNLGILQALAKARLLRTVDYVSTVSGGGYIGSWLMAWMYHQKIGIKQVEKYLASQSESPSQTAERPEVRFLRNYSNYLTPRKGLLGADFWTFACSYLRNTFLNQTILVLLLLSVLLVPRSIVTVLHFLERLENHLQNTSYNGPLQEYMYAQYFALALGTVFGLVGLVFMGRNLLSLDPDRNKRYRWFTQQGWVQRLIVVPLLLAAGLTTYGFGHFLWDFDILGHPWTRLPILGVALYAGQWVLALLVRWMVWSKRKTANLGGPANWLLLTTAVFTGALIGFLFIPFARLLIPAGAEPGTTFSNWRVLTFGTPAFVLIMLLAGVLHIGLMGRGMSDAYREWWGRLGGWLVIYSTCWLFLFGIAIYFPFALHKLLEHSPRLTWTGAITWIASTLYGVLFGKSAGTAALLPDAPAKQKFLGYLARVAPYVFILGFLLLLSLLAAKIAHAVGGISGTVLRLPQGEAFYTWKVPATCFAFLAATLLLSWRVDVNEFSIHHLYRNRLVRCYLGASVPGRNAQPFTGFSDTDDVPLAALQIPDDAQDGVDDRPLPILNTSLNVVRGKELALQTRKARSFALTPLYAGFTRPIAGSMSGESVFAPTRTAAADRIDSKFGLRLGTAMAISGAAASPNMGSYSAPDLAFLMTLFDVRLGWWMSNPKGKFWRHGSPYIGFYWLLRELLGATDDDSQYVYLSDGGHFENLAMYELVRRRCKVIIACDASCDAAYGCSDLHNAMERCRVDFGVEIEMKADEIGKILPDGKPPRATAHYAVGAIHYVPGDPASDGVLIYLKPALVKDDAADLLGYAATNSEFPHDTTANQFFDESHFENYRAMGEATGRTARAAIEQALNKIAILRAANAPSTTQADPHTSEIAVDTPHAT